MQVHFQIASNSLEKAIEENNSTSKLFIKYYAKHCSEEEKLLTIFNFLEYNVDDIKEILGSSVYLHSYRV